MLALSSAIGIAALSRTAFLALRPATPTLLLAPMIGVMEPCILLADAPAPGEGLARTCTGPDGSASALVESTLSALAPRSAASQGYELGYTLQVPLLKLFKASGGDWVIDSQTVARLVRTLRDTDRPAIVYLFSTHFGVDAPIEEALNADSRNLSATADGPLQRGTYYSAPVYSWTLATTQTGITARRVQATRAVLDEICKLPARDIAKVRGVTLLGELHHLFPDFEGGMRFTGTYAVSDYSEASRTGFRLFLRRKYGSIAQLNQLVGASWASFDEVDPPSRDVRTTPLRGFAEHIDSFAHGSFPVTGWVHVKSAAGAPPPKVRIYRNGELVGTAPVMLGRQDVLQALPELGDANTGWRYDMDFRRLPVGMHRLDILLENGSGPLVQLATRHVAIMDRTQQPPAALPQRPLPASVPAGAEVRSSVDLPADQSSYFYNPLVPLWHAFRGQQVVDYLEYFGNVVAQSCLARVPRYTHQIVPFTNPSWDENKYAAAESLQPLQGIGLGVSLYGEATDGTSFVSWLETTRHTRYGVTEFHPLKAMKPRDFRGMLERHAQRGASFISFFLEPRWNGRLVSRGHNLFSLDPDNARFGSSVLYEAVGQTLRGAP